MAKRKRSLAALLYAVLDHGGLRFVRQVLNGGDAFRLIGVSVSRDSNDPVVRANETPAPVPFLTRTLVDEEKIPRGQAQRLQALRSEWEGARR